MEIKVIGTGSRGNSYLVHEGGYTVVLDAGCKFNSVSAANNHNVADISACFVTHKHTDHAKYIKDFLKHGIPVYTNGETIENYGEKNYMLKSIQVQKVIHIDDLRVVAFAVPHDNVMNFAYIIMFPTGRRLLYATDYEYIKFNVAPLNITDFLIECNHSEEVSDESANYSHVYLGHASLEATESFLRRSCGSHVKTITLCHLSDINADRERILTTIRNIDETIRVEIAENGKEYNYE